MGSGDGLMDVTIDDPAIRLAIEGLEARLNARIKELEERIENLSFYKADSVHGHDYAQTSHEHTDFAWWDHHHEVPSP